MNPSDANQSAHDESQSLLHEAMQCHQQGNLFDADRLYAQALTIAPDNAQALRLRGILARECGDLDSSLRLLKQAATAAPDDPEPAGEIALSHIAAGQYSEAEHILRATLQRAPDYHKGLINLGALLQHRGHLRAAIGCYQQVLQTADDIEVRCNLAKAYADAGDNEQALDACNIALEQSSRHPYALATLGAVLTDLERYAEARVQLTEATAQAPDDMALVNLALACYELDDPEAAITHLQQALDINPYNARAAADLVNALLATGAADAALKLCTDFLHAHPGERLMLAAYALALQSTGQFDAALRLTDAKLLTQRHTLAAPAGFDDLSSFNSALSELIRTHPSLLSNPVSKSTFGGDQTGELDPAESPALTGLADGINRAIANSVKAYAKADLRDHPVLQPAADNWTLRIWGTRLRAGGRQTPHMHPLSWLSGVYYPHLPTDMNADDAAAGQLEFGRPPSRFYRTTEPQQYLHAPREGELIVFPSWFWHQTMPFASGDDRVSIAFDVMPQTTLQML